MRGTARRLRFRPCVRSPWRGVGRDGSVYLNSLTGFLEGLPIAVMPLREANDCRLYGLHSDRWFHPDANRSNTVE